MALAAASYGALATSVGVGTSATISPASGRRWRLYAWDLGVSQNTAVASVDIQLNGVSVARFVCDQNGSGVATGGVAPSRRWVSPPNIAIDGAANDALSLVVAGTGAVVDGELFMITMP